MEGSTTPRDILVVFFKHKALLLLVFMAIVVPVTVITFMLSPVYEATATLLIKFGREYLYRPEVGEGKAVLQANHNLMQEALVNSEIEILTSRDLQARVITSLGIDHLFPARRTARAMQEKVITSLGIDRLLPAYGTSPAQDRDPLGDAVKHFEQQLTVERIKKSDVLRVSFQHNDPHMAAQAVNVLIDLFQEKRLGVLKDPNASAFLQQQVDAYRQQLEEAERKLRDFLHKHPNFSHTQQRSLLLTSREGTETTLKTTQSRIVELQKKLAFLKGQMQFIAENTPLSTEPDAAIDTVKARLLALRLREQEIVHKFKDQHPNVLGIRKEIKQAEAFLREVSNSKRVTVGKNVLHQDIKREMIQTEAELRAQEAKVAVVTQQLAHMDTDLQALADKEKELRELQRELARSENNYQTYITKLEETRLVDEMDRQKIANIRVVQAATVPVEPVKPRKRLYIALGVLFGAFAAVGLVFFSEYIGQGLSTPESVERRLGLPVLVTVPVKRLMRRVRRQLARLQPPPHDPQTEKRPPPLSKLDMEEEMIDLYTTIAGMLPGPGTKLLQFIGSREGEGTSTLIREFARVAYVRFNKSVFLLDAISPTSRHPHDQKRRTLTAPPMRQRRLSTSPQPSDQQSHLEVVEHEPDLMGEMAQELIDSRFLVCPVSKLGGSLTEVLGSPHLESFFDKLKQHFDFILIDSPPVTRSALGLALVHKVDGVLLVVEAEKTRWPVARHVKNRVIAAQGNLLGVILNKRRYYLPSFIYKWLIGR